MMWLKIFLMSGYCGNTYVFWKQIFLLHRKLSWPSKGKTSRGAAIRSLMKHNNKNGVLRSLLHLFWKTKPKSLPFTSSERIQYSTCSIKCFTITFKNTRTVTTNKNKQAKNPMMLKPDDLKNTLNIYRQMKKTLSRSPWCLLEEINMARPSPALPFHMGFITTRSPREQDRHPWEDMEGIHSQAGALLSNGILCLSLVS